MTNLRCRSPDVAAIAGDVAAVAALPSDHLVLLEDIAPDDVLQQGLVALFMLLLDFADLPEEIGYLGEALFTCGPFETGVHVGPLEVLTGGCGRQVGRGVADSA